MSMYSNLSIQQKAELAAKLTFGEAYHLFQPLKSSDPDINDRAILNDWNRAVKEVNNDPERIRQLLLDLLGQATVIYMSQRLDRTVVMSAIAIHSILQIAPEQQHATLVAMLQEYEKFWLENKDNAELMEAFK